MFNLVLKVAKFSKAHDSFALHIPISAKMLCHYIITIFLIDVELCIQINPLSKNMKHLKHNFENRVFLGT